MGTTPQELTGPDLKKGIPLNTIDIGGKILGHADGEAVLLVRTKEKIFAIGALCTHYGANLHDGIVTEDVVRCPWHHACFDLETGAAKKAPALNPVSTWKVEVQDGKIFVREKSPEAKKDISVNSKENFVIIGSGAAGHAAAEMLRREGFGGRITLLTEDSALPYDRPNLSKDYLAGNAPEEWIPLRPAEFYENQNINIRLNTKVSKLKPDEKVIVLDDGAEISFDKCLISTGGSPRRPKILGLDEPNVYFLRSFSDCKALIASLENAKKVVILGAGFIGLEAAAALRSRDLKVVVIDPNPLPLVHIVGEKVGVFIKSVHEKNGVKFHLSQSATQIKDGVVTLEKGGSESADVILVATGIQPNDNLASEAGLQCQNGILVNDYLQTSSKDIYAAGDVARCHDQRIEHWVVAQRQGQTAALNMLGKNKTYLEVPFFWTQQFAVTLSYVGYAKSFTKIALYGDLEALDAAVAYYEKDKIAAVLTIGRDQDSLKIEQAFEKQDQEQIKKILSTKESQ